MRIPVVSPWWIREFGLPATTPLLALIYWACLNRWEASRGVRHHSGAAALLVGVAVVFFFVDVAILAPFTLFYGLALLMLGSRLRDYRLVLFGAAAGILALMLMGDLLFAVSHFLLLALAGGAIASLWWEKPIDEATNE